MQEVSLEQRGAGGGGLASLFWGMHTAELGVQQMRFQHWDPFQAGAPNVTLSTVGGVTVWGF